MAVLKLLILISTLVLVKSFPREPLKYRNTIFDDEKLKGEAFEFVDSFNSITLYNNVENPFRLPATTRPVHYDILWTINMSNLSFTGEVVIDLVATQPNVNEIVLHAHDLSITEVHLTRENSTVFQTYALQPAYRFLRVQLLSGFLNYDAVPIIYKLRIGFEAPLRTDMNGIYRSWFKNNATDNERWMATTFFAPSGARLAFPCFDEPAYKATFDITIRRPIGYSSWACTIIKETRNSTVIGYEEDQFHTTPIMSTYLLAFVVAEYESVNDQDLHNGIPMFEVIARPSAIASGQGDYAFEVGQELLSEMSQYTDIDFYSVHPYIKMTHAAIPDFSAGAMENWGLLAYREAYLMYDKENTNSNFKQIIAYIVSHEIVHMWFGNLVTCDWWDALWLNEGFARYYQYFLTDKVEDNMGFPSRFINEQIHTSMLTDSADNPHPLTNIGVSTPASVDAMFSTITYNKGASVIRMTDHLLGSDVHREGLRRYLKNRALGTAKPIHLFEALNEAAIDGGAIFNYGPEFSVIDYYKTWTEQGGHPVLNVDVNHRTGQMTVYQRRFNINSGYSTASTNWIIPITFATASNPDFANTKPTHIITDAITIINRTSSGDEWVIFNKQQTGYYRVNYDDYTWNLVTILLRGPNRTLVHEYNRAQIVDDVFQFARSGLMSYNRAFNILSFLINETEYTPWVAAITGYNWIYNRLVNTSLGISLDLMFRNWATPLMDQLTYYPQPNETFMRSYLRYQLAPVMCRSGAPACRQAAIEQFERLRLNNTEVPVDSRNWVYCYALQDGTEEHFDFLWNRYLSHNVYTEKILLLQTLGCTPHANSLNTLLDGIIQDNFIIRPQDYTTAFNAAANVHNTQIVFRYIQNNLQAVIDAFGSATTPLSYISSRLRSVQEVTEFREWANSNKEILGTSYQSVYNGADTYLNTMQWIAEVEDDIQSYLVSGDEALQTSTEAPTVITTPDTVTQTPVIESSTPVIPNAATISVVSKFVLIIGFIVNLIFYSV